MSKGPLVVSIALLVGFFGVTSADAALEEGIVGGAQANEPAVRMPATTDHGGHGGGTTHGTARGPQISRAFPTSVSAPQSVQWRRLAVQPIDGVGERFNLPPNTPVRFGNSDASTVFHSGQPSYNYFAVSGEGRCDPSFFGTSPVVPWVVRECSIPSDVTPLALGPDNPGIVGTPIVDNASIPPPTNRSFDRPYVRATSELASNAEGGTGAFRISCGFSHMSYDDPIVYPGQPGRAHLHVFFGNTGTNANSNSASIAASGNSTCSGGTINRSAYWVPAMVDTATGRPMPPPSTIWYYKSFGTELVGDIMQPPPPGLRVIAGRASNVGRPGEVPFAGGWNCLQHDGNNRHNYAMQRIPNCDPALHSHLEASIAFPNCWDGVNLDSADHASHMAYTGFYESCPSSHPVPLVMPSLNLSWPIPPEGLSAWRLASDSYGTNDAGGYSLHADFWNGWDPVIAEEWVEGCIRQGKDCHAHLLGDRREFYAPF